MAVVLEPAEADPDIPGQHQIEERRHLHRAAAGDVEHEQQPEFRGLIEHQRGDGGDDPGRRWEVHGAVRRDNIQCRPRERGDPYAVPLLVERLLVIVLYRSDAAGYGSLHSRGRPFQRAAPALKRECEGLPLLRPAPSIRAAPARRAARRRDIRRSSPTVGRIFHDRAHLVPTAFSTTTATPGTSFSRNAFGRRVVIGHHRVRGDADLGQIDIEQRAEDLLVRNVDQRRGFQRRADALGRALDFQRAGDDAADVADGLPLRSQRIVAEILKALRKQGQMHRRLGVRPVHPPRFLGGETQHRRQPFQDRIADECRWW